MQQIEHLRIGDDWISFDVEDGGVGARAGFYKSRLDVYGVESSIRVSDAAELSLHDDRGIDHAGRLYMTGDDGKEYRIRIDTQGKLYAEPR